MNENRQNKFFKYPHFKVSGMWGSHTIWTVSLDEARTNLLLPEDKRVSLVPPPPPSSSEGPQQERVLDPISFTVPIAYPIFGRDFYTPSWFNTADSVLQCLAIYPNHAVMAVRPRWVEGSRLEVWPEDDSWVISPIQHPSSCENKKRSPVLIQSPLQQSDKPNPPPGIEPLLTITVDPSPPDAEITASCPAPPLTLSPSRTYPLRKAILYPIAGPVLLVLLLVDVLGIQTLLMIPIWVLIAVCVAWALKSAGIVKVSVVRTAAEEEDAEEEVEGERVDGRGGRINLDQLADIEGGLSRR